jgi:hypothetical protein
MAQHLENAMNVRISAVVALLLTAAAAPALAAQASGTVNASATVIQPLTITQTQAMDFGKLVMNSAANAAGTVVVAPNNGRTQTGGVDLVSSTPTAGIVSVVGQSGSTYTVTLPASAVSLSDGTHTMSVDTFNSSDTLATVSGTNSIHIGATLHAAQNQAAGAYTGSFTVTAAYE